MIWSEARPLGVWLLKGPSCENAGTAKTMTAATAGSNMRNDFIDGREALFKPTLKVRCGETSQVADHCPWRRADRSIRSLIPRPFDCGPGRLYPAKPPARTSVRNSLCNSVFSVVVLFEA